MTINKSQRQTFDHVGIYLDEPVFSHAQLYVALSRSRIPNHVKIYTKTSKVQGKLLNNEEYFTRNVVYQEILFSFIHSRKKSFGEDASGEDSMSESESDEDTSSISSSQGVLTNETDALYVCTNSLLHEELPISYTCTHPFSKVARQHTLSQYVEESDYYYYIFSSNTYLDILPNEFAIVFTIDRTHYNYSTSIGNCSQSKSCQLPIPIGSHPKVVVQMEGVNGTLRSEKLQVTCKPREWIFLIFYALFLIVIFLCAFQ
ncbi:hypothetical protein AVEN_13223-1 [Araneus ventricosus]|uniref:E3 ubiquitin-protein ligase APD1-4 middle domain-containing protein n=1 Tax=Araneus ventricosus TaxID=182803 RepID=A0A4Y2DMU7_ARAVE|nr:hypothetical protein AVEN_13223-1 [Araneus ventricosus]